VIFIAIILLDTNKGMRCGKFVLSARREIKSVESPMLGNRFFDSRHGLMRQEVLKNYTLGLEA